MVNWPPATATTLQGSQLGPVSGGQLGSSRALCSFILPHELEVKVSLLSLVVFRESAGLGLVGAHRLSDLQDTTTGQGTYSYQVTGCVT